MKVITTNGNELTVDTIDGQLMLTTPDGKTRSVVGLKQDRGCACRQDLPCSKGDCRLRRYSISSIWQAGYDRMSGYVAKGHNSAITVVPSQVMEGFILVWRQDGVWSGSGAISRTSPIREIVKEMAPAAAVEVLY